MRKDGRYYERLIRLVKDERDIVAAYELEFEAKRRQEHSDAELARRVIKSGPDFKAYMVAQQRIQVASWKLALVHWLMREHAMKRAHAQLVVMTQERAPLSFAYPTADVMVDRYIRDQSREA